MVGGVSVGGGGGGEGVGVLVVVVACAAMDKSNQMIWKGTLKEIYL